MKKNNLLAYLQKLFKNHLLIILLVSVIVRIIYAKYIFHFNDNYADCATYLKAAQSFSFFKIDSLRTPLYPLFIFSLKLIFPTYDLNKSIFVFQSLIGIITTLLIYKIAVKLFIKKYSLILGLIFAVNYYFISWEYIIFSECLLMFFIALHLITIINYFKDFSTRNAIAVHGSMVLLMFCKPIFLYYFIFVYLGFVLFSIFFNHVKKYFILGTTLTILNILLIVLYINLNQKQNKIHAFTETSLLHKYRKVYDYKLYKIDPEGKISKFMQDTAIINKLQHNNCSGCLFVKNAEVESKQNLYSYFGKLFNKNPKKFTMIFLKGTFYNCITAIKRPISKYYIKVSVPLLDPFKYTPILFALLISLFDIIISIEKFRKRIYNCFELVWIFIDFIIIYVFMLMVVASFDEFERLFYPAYFSIILLVFKYSLYLYERILRLYLTFHTTIHSSK